MSQPDYIVQFSRLGAPVKTYLATRHELELACARFCTNNNLTRRGAGMQIEFFDRDGAREAWLVYFEPVTAYPRLHDL